jgi:archaellum biogenesis ATPase FlaH
MKNVFKAAAIVIVMIVATAFQGKAQTKQEIANMRKELKRLTDADKLIQQRLIKFDTLDFIVFSRQQWVRFHETHGKPKKISS